MKIIVIENTEPCNKIASDALFSVMKSCPRLWMKADSALLKNNKPFFIPEFTRECSASVYLALRISRMGKSVPARFAHRYYDAYTVAVDFTAEDLLRHLREAGEPWDMAKSFDASVAIGEFVEFGEYHHSVQVRASLSVNGTEVSENVCDDVNGFVDDALEKVSRIFTIRQGDLVLVGKPNSKAIVKINDHLTASLNGQTLLDFNVK